jgi:hypothetical protein
MTQGLNRREFLWGSAVAGASALGLTAPALAANKAPSAPVSIARCREYDLKEVARQLETMLDQLGGLRKLVAGKTVAVKVNLTGNARQKALDLPAGRTYQVHPQVVLATATLLDRAGAKRIRFLEGTYQKGPFEDLLKDAGWDLKALAALKAKVEYEDTRNKGQGTRYHEVKVPGGGSLFPGYLLKHRFCKCTLTPSPSSAGGGRRRPGGAIAHSFSTVVSRPAASILNSGNSCPVSSRYRSRCACWKSRRTSLPVISCLASSSRATYSMARQIQDHSTRFFDRTSSQARYLSNSSPSAR